MTTEEKAKAYDEALEKAKEYHEKYWQVDAKYITETLFPELRESEEETTRKELLDFVRSFWADHKEKLPQASRWVSYLEKQKEPTTEELYAEAGTTEKEYIANTMKMVRAMREKKQEQKPEDKEITLTNFEEVLNTFLFDFANSPIEDCEPKEYTKKHSAEILKAAYAELNAQLKQDIFEAQQEGRREGYEAAKAEQKPAEWSEEDKKILADTIFKLAGFMGNEKNIDWLKSLRTSWKPSEEQMKAFRGYIEDFQGRVNAAVGGWNNFDVMIRLYEQLKKL